jgi:LytS/YehU family sensor histidine kinase
VVVHVGAAALLTVIHLSVTGALYWFTNTRGSLQMPSMVWQIRSLIQGYGMLDLVTYGGIVGAVFAVDFYRRFRDEEITTAGLQLRAAQLESTMNQARLDALRMELNPHFLFNTLNAISGLVRRNENDAAVSMLARLGDLLRVTLERDSAQEVPLETELEVLQSYLAIERIRFHDRLVVDVDVQPNALSALVPTLILQPLVENAVRHGVAPVPGPGRVSIAARRTNGHLVIEVRDTGPGFRENSGKTRRGVGLTNTASRLEQLYGDHAHLDLGTNPGGGAAVSMTLPFRTGSEEGESNVDT